MENGSTWNYRIMKNEEGRYGLFEVYYDEAGGVQAWTANPRTGLYENPDEIIEDLELMLADCKLGHKSTDIIDMKDYPEKV